MKKKSTPKLTLSKETLRRLTLTEPSLVQGGTDPVPVQDAGGELIETCYRTCVSVCPGC